MSRLPLTLALMLAGCSAPPPGTPASAPSPPPAASEPDPTPSALPAKALVRGRDGSLLGEARLLETVHGVQLTFDATGLPPGEHGFHVHETGDCSAEDFTSAGGHFAPFGASHGKPGEASHVGDLGNLSVPPSGAVKVTRALRRATLRDTGPGSLIAGDGTAVIVHEKADDQTSQPSGAAGPRIACGVIKRES